ncbi:TRAP transporter small permease [Falsiroseomonas tokyonensis]|uniref:TRAP transporter small permease protein n=1 Tax=Falsiroseomonas tokyonensis TaxID=430521 RepID=A0ABV7C333_9PROT|nr:TRAP transporter small permease [Falsiroseomonas tokyonensis]MBU8541371.1 TRAP transporter small permease subunit [Falsiroseomonas tokyonensis]
MRALRSGLDLLYLAGGIAGGVALASIGAIIALQVIGRQFGLSLDGADDLTAFAVAGSALLPLAYAFRQGAHIRVDLIIGHVKGGTRFAMEALALVLGAGLALFLAYSVGDLAYDSWQFEDVAQGTVPWLLWIPQAACAVGCGLFALALLDDLAVHLAGGTPSYRRVAEETAVERAMGEI